mmetsp:Transcript_987/g.1553  ORF Transcript_987/g.1553 Transcript_987/m.1553 type:complete len:119 (-) Transcript_987:1434-1790(-)|eukprot:CAMPEP_0170455716 /NCGR_PEP_ID=MMETSP0123-20130129/3584_1 /TAXON_ID=182087 /ORGANISM="Favella ehrenbergii, Strain Fehren 1" /LENGTH=118 /DNA_ID=CAMNT_0010718939 /DNA_START=582 /DNA_END=938 /DNA_ORIENTATION=+
MPVPRLSLTNCEKQGMSDSMQADRSNTGMSMLNSERSGPSIEERALQDISSQVVNLRERPGIRVLNRAKLEQHQVMGQNPTQVMERDSDHSQSDMEENKPGIRTIFSSHSNRPDVSAN